MSAAQEHRVVERRTVVLAVGAVGAAAALTACGGSDGSVGGSGGTGGTDPVEQPGSGGAGGAVLAKTADIPEGGGMVFAAQKVVVTQPRAGEFKAFSATCTHQGCAVKDVTDNVITCPCHNSTFDAATGSPTGGPATQPLPARQISVEGGAITLA
ncbi:Rieske (2Fe-2S) protein [Streptomyces bacillaris]|uniref:Cytochrome bc1 complex Rieske iron-sulfur subunit n=1 Tax=Streptomyces cavourensis TaxID=67258 RepID=A0AAD0VI30_9ACTN|nr:MULTISPECIES: Rieske (2Fe-2S) protein [Streptomyces]NUW22891.1 Rieske (2Fe-2S) protein [Streptomyces roseoviolaceus]ATY99809.1 iron-sulfur protein [Streptomyces cavourensis]AXI75636.1 Rieske (2Fe-2S) protein [Streptomyces cavourensis]NUV44268.1 Rieske (2Fe-2S) protein [Streptomyces sp. CAI-24]NUV82368.1 Rieske (2Fe-2S) protein [Streptomyces sp. CAI-155]